MMEMKPIKAVLFDLDGTLLDYDINAFMQKYYKKMAARFFHLVSPENFMEAMKLAVYQTMANQGPETNEEVFKRAFFPAVGRSSEELMPIFDDFYRMDFPSFYDDSFHETQAVDVMRKTVEKGYLRVIATNPLFPEVATMQRLKWAGLADFEFALVTTYENSRATKSSLKYYQDILDYIGLPAESCLMVGDQHWDLIAANLGMQTFLVSGSNTDLQEDTPTPTYRGTLADLINLL